MTAAWEIMSARLGAVSIAAPGGELAADALATRVEQMATALREAGVERGHPVAIVLPQDVDLPVAMLAVWATGGVPFPLDARLPRAEIASSLAKAGAAFAIAQTDLGISWMEPNGDMHGRANGPTRPADEALLLGTSGTAGRPKIASLSVDAVAAIRDRFPLGPDQTYLAALPLAHAFGLFVALLAPLSLGARIVVADWTDPAATIAFASKHRASVMPAVPRMVTQLLRTDLRNLGTIRAIVVGGAPARSEDLIELQERFGILVGYGYGMTETAAVTTLNLHIAEKPGSVGRPFHGVEVRITASDGSPMPAGETGEVWLRDTAVSSGYVDEGAVAAADGWLRTGDLGFLDDENYLTIIGRAKDIIITSGYNVVPSEVEAVLETFPGVAEAAVFGRAHPELGEEVVALVVPDNGSRLDVDALRAHARERLAHYKVPRTIAVGHRELPRTSVGKVVRWRLAQEVS
ncbi:MAG: AMP-binding protein [Actinomycetota bacterium]